MVVLLLVKYILKMRMNLDFLIKIIDQVSEMTVRQRSELNIQNQF